MKHNLSLYELEQTFLSLHEKLMGKFHVILIHLQIDSFIGDDFSKSI